MRRLFRLWIGLTICVVVEKTMAQQCPSERSISGWMLQRHVYKTTSADLGLHCLLSCSTEDRCQSFNFVMSSHMCEFSDRTKEATPEDFIRDPDRYYFGKRVNRVPLGSIPELAAESCKEIKMSEVEASSGKYWLSSIKPGIPLFAFCNMTTEDIDECTTSSSPCHVNAQCNNTIGSYRCACNLGYTGNGKTCTVCAPLGVSDRKAIQDVRMTATTVYPDSVNSCYPGNGRLNGIKGWCPRTSSDRTDYLQVDMGSVHSLCAVATQGFKGGIWRTTSYKLHLSTDGVTWNSYKENNVEKVFQGNTNNQDVVQHWLTAAVKARFVRFYPVTANGHPSLRVEIYVLK